MLPLVPGAQRLVDAAEQARSTRSQEALGTYHWLVGSLDRFGPMAADLIGGLDARQVLDFAQQQLGRGEVGTALDRETAVQRASQRAAASGASRIYERDLLAVILAAAGYTVQGGSFAVTPGRLPSPAPATEGAAAVQRATSADQPSGPPVAVGYHPRASKPTPTLERFGTDLTRRAQESQQRPVVGRESEVELVIETLCRETKRNPILVGPAGVGKTAIVEGLAQRVVRGQVPSILRGVRVLAIQPASLVAGAHMAGELEKRMQSVLAEASQDGILLFIDEVHSMIGAGGSVGSGDVASLLKPALARGDLACIAATTDDEFRRFIEADGALERRFQPIRVQEMTRDQTLTVLASLRDDLNSRRGVSVPDGVLTWLVDFAQQFLRNRHFPDKGVDLLEQVVAYGVVAGKQSIDVSDADVVARRMIGMPTGVQERLATLGTLLRERGCLGEADVTALLTRLAVTMRGLDLRTGRPNAVLLLIDEAASRSGELSATIAEALFGTADRVLTLDLSRMSQEHDVTQLIGSPPGYVGYSDSLPLHRLAQSPWCVLRCEGIDACHPRVLQILVNGLANGAITDARGRRTYLSDAVVVATAGVKAGGGRRSLGFTTGVEPSSDGASSEEAVRAAAERALGVDLVGTVDLVVASVPSTAEVQRRQLEHEVLADLAERYRKHGLDLTWDASLVEWLVRQRDDRHDHSWERVLDARLSPLLLAVLPERPNSEQHRFRVRVVEGAIQIDPREGEE